MSARAAWREPMLWLVLALPASVLGAAAWTIACAAGGSDATGAQVRRTAQIQIEDLGPDREAARLNLAGELRLADRMLVVNIDGAPATDALHVVLEHPVHAALDRSLVLATRDGRWQTPIEALDTGHAWNVRATDAAGTWRLQGRWSANTAGTALHPAVER